MIIRYSYEIVESSLVMPKAEIPKQRPEKLSAPTLLIVIMSTTPFKNQGLAIESDFDTAIRKHEFLKILRISSSNMRCIRSFRISAFVALWKNTEDKILRFIIKVLD